MIRLASPGSWSLKTKFAFCGGALALLYSIAFTSWTLRTMRADVVSSVSDGQRTLVRSTADAIDGKIEARRDALVETAAALSEVGDLVAIAANAKAFFGSQVVIRDMFDGLAIADPQGRFVFDTDPAAGRVGSVMAMRPYFEALRAGAPATISSPFRARIGGSPLLVVFAAPLRARDGTFAGALLGSIDLERANFLGGIADARIGRAGRFTLIENAPRPVIVMHTDRTRILTPVDPAKNAELARALAGYEGTAISKNADGMEALRSAAMLRSVPWLLTAVYPTAEAFAGLRDREFEALTTGAVLFVLAATTVWLMTSWLLRPLRRLRILIGRHAAEPDLKLEPESFGSAELAELVVAYNAQASTRLGFEMLLRDSERRVREIADNMPASIAYIDRDERYRFANARVVNQFGDAGGTVIGRTLKAVRGEAEYAEIEPHVARALLGETVSFEGRNRVDGRLRSTQSQFIPDHDESGRVSGFYKMTFDITALQEAKDRQVLVEQRLRAISDHLPALIAHVDRDERYDFLNATFKTWLGIDPDTAIGRRMSEVLDPAIYANRRENIARCLAGETICFEWEENLLGGRKTLRIEYLPDFALDGSVTGFYTFSSDVTELKDAQNRLNRLVRSDSLTGLDNRFQFEESLPLAIARCKQGMLGMALIFLDIDHFKKVNDGSGHAVGDLLLKEFGGRLKRCVRTTDTVARLGGDEFVMILEGLHADGEATRVAEAVLNEIRRPFTLGATVLKATTSIGIAFFPRLEDDVIASEMLARADAALYVAKAAGRDRFQMSIAGRDGLPE